MFKNFINNLEFYNNNFLNFFFIKKMEKIHLEQCLRDEQTFQNIPKLLQKLQNIDSVRQATSIKMDGCSNIEMFSGISYRSNASSSCRKMTDKTSLRCLDSQKNCFTTQGEEIDPIIKHSKTLKEKNNQTQQGFQNSKKKNYQNNNNNNQTELNKQNVKKRKKWFQLKQLIAKKKIKKLSETFTQKLRRNNICSGVSQFSEFSQENSNSFWNQYLHQKGFQFNEKIAKIINLFSLITIVLLLFFFSLTLVYPDLQQTQFSFNIEIIGIVFYLFEIIQNFITIRYSLGKKKETLREIGSDYYSKEFYVDLFNIITMFLSALTNLTVFKYFRMILIFKLPQALEKLQKLQVQLIQNYYYEQYWSLVKVFLFNFCFAHILAISLTAMSFINNENNWLTQRGIQNCDWFEKYVWSYYWGTTIMLTIGFGDFVPKTYQQAGIVLLIQTVSTIVLAYNISCVGSLIANIRSQDLEKSKNLKIFKKLARKNHIPQQNTWKINNYLEESANIKKKFNIQQQKQFVQKLPEGYKKDFLKQANRNIFKKVLFFSSMLEKTDYSLAQVIEMRITHPEEIIQSIEKSLDIYILKNGLVGFCCKKQESNLNDKIIDSVKISEGENPFLLSTNFLSKKTLNCEIKSIVYSVIYYLNYEKFIDIICANKMDYQMFCYLKDKSKNIIDEFEFFNCQFCKTKHTKFDCPKLHYLPICQHVINKHLYQSKKQKNKRNKKGMRIQFQKKNSFDVYEEIKQFSKQQLGISKIFREKKTKNSIFIRKKLDNDKSSFQTGNQRNLSHNLQRIQSTIIENTIDINKDFMGKNTHNFDNYEDECWSLKIDKLHNYNDYFSECNSNKIRNLNYDDRQTQQCSQDSKKSILCSDNMLKPNSALSIVKEENLSFCQI